MMERPTNKSLNNLILRSDHVRITYNNLEDIVNNKEVYIDLIDRSDIKKIEEKLFIIEDKSTIFYVPSYCKCTQDYTFEFYSKNKVIAEITVRGGDRLRWEKWTGEADLQDGHGLVKLANNLISEKTKQKS